MGKVTPTLGLATDIKLFEVGGSIRDELLGIQDIPDRDFCAESPRGWDALIDWCHARMSKVFLVSPEFFTIRGQIGKDTIDVVMCRIDGHSSDGRHPDLVEPGTLFDDLARRDFTVNAMAREVDIETLEPIGDIIDPFHGAEDLRAGVLRTVGPSIARLEEDGLRLLRAARFAVTKALRPDGELQVCLESAAMWKFSLEALSSDRIRGELHKMMSFNTAASLEFLVRHCPVGVLGFLFGETTGLWLKPTSEKKRRN